MVLGARVCLEGDSREIPGGGKNDFGGETDRPGEGLRDLFYCGLEGGGDALEAGESDLLEASILLVRCIL